MSNATLSIWLWSDGLSFSTSATSVFLSVPSGPDWVKRAENIVLEHDELLQDYETVTCRVTSGRVCFVPADTTAGDAHCLYQFALPATQSTEVVLVDESYADVHVVYGIDETLYHFLQRTFPGVEFHHELGELHSQYLARVAAGSSNVLVATISHNLLFVHVYRDSALQLANVYDTAEVDSMAYYVMNTWNECRLDALRDVLLLHDGRHTSPRLHDMLATWVKHTIDISDETI